MKMVHLIVGRAERSKLAAVLPYSASDSEDASPCGFHSGGNCRTETIPQVLMKHPHHVHLLKWAQAGALAHLKAADGCFYE